jgi:hypothetical protein
LELRRAAALVSLLDYALTLARTDLLEISAGQNVPLVPDAAAQQAARLLLVNPALKAAAGFLALSVE